MGTTLSPNLKRQWLEEVVLDDGNFRLGIAPGTRALQKAFLPANALLPSESLGDLYLATLCRAFRSASSETAARREAVIIGETVARPLKSTANLTLVLALQLP